LYLLQRARAAEVIGPEISIQDLHPRWGTHSQGAPGYAATLRNAQNGTIGLDSSLPAFRIHGFVRSAHVRT